MQIDTKRLVIRLASDDEMRRLVADEPNDDMKQAYAEMLEHASSNPGLRQWFAAWMIENHEGMRIGDLCFKGLDSDGVVEIGYGLVPEFWGQGYASEAVCAMVSWAFKQPGVQFIEAEIEEHNAASRRVLEKSGFVPTGVNGEEGPRYRWRGSF